MNASARTPSGSMRSPLIGGGTANIEFEALTGQSTSQFNPQMTTPYQMLVPKERTYPSAVGYFEAKGDRTVAIHPFRPQMYRRDEVYPILGFDRTVFQSAMQEEELPEAVGARGFDDGLELDGVAESVRAHELHDACVVLGCRGVEPEGAVGIVGMTVIGARDDGGAPPGARGRDRGAGAYVVREWQVARG